MSEKSKRVSSGQSRTDTLIGAGLRVEGSIASTGVVRIQGEVCGDVTCDADADGTVVVDKSGKVTGAIRAPHILVGGHVTGPLRSLESLEIQQGACVSGDAEYKLIDIRAGGVLEGMLTPSGMPDESCARQEHRIQIPAPAARFDAWRKPGAALALLVAVLAAVLLYRGPTPVAPPASDAASAADSATKGTAAQAAPAASGAPQDASRAAVAADAVPPVPGPDANAGSGARDFPPAVSEADPDKVVRVQGVNPAKPEGFFLLVGKEPAVLYKKRRQDPGEGRRIDVARGTTVSIPVARDDVVRVVQGGDIEIFYQGRKVAQKTIESGAWMSFVPLMR